MEGLKKGIELLLRNKLKIVSVFFFVFVFLFLIFPYEDLGHLLTSTINEQSGNRIYVKADDLKLSLFPLPGIAASDVMIEPGNQGTKFVPLHLEQLKVRPRYSSLLAFRGGASIDGEGLFGGGVSISASTSNSFFSKDPGPIQIADFEMSNVSLAAIADYAVRMMAPGAEGPKFSGQLSAETSGLTIDPSMKDGITGDLTLMIQNLALPTRIPLPGFGALDFPAIKIPRSEFKTQWLNSGKVRIVTGNLGTSKDPMSGRLLGEIELRPTPQGYVAGAFNFCLELNFSQPIWDQLNKDYSVIIVGMGSVLNTYKRTAASGASFGLRVSGFNLADLFSGQAPLQPGDCNSMAAAP